MVTALTVDLLKVVDFEGDLPGEVPDGDPNDGGPIPIRLECSDGDLILTWDSAPRADTHAIYRGPLSSFASLPWNNPAAPIDDPENALIACDLTLLCYVDEEECLAGGESHYFLIVGWNTVGQGPIGEGSVGGVFQPRPPSMVRCP